MNGYIGERARRRKRNFVSFFIIIFIIIFIYYILPIFKFSDLKPANSLLPSEEEILSPKMITTIEDLELKIFDQEQKIIFRNKQINKFKNKITNISIENKNLLESLEDLNISMDTSSSNKDLIKEKDIIINTIKNKKQNEIKKLNERILNLENENKQVLNENRMYKNDFNNKNKELKSIFSRNLKLKNINQNNIKEIDELQNILEEQNLIIRLLKDKTPHG